MSDGSFNALFFGGDSRGEEFMKWMFDDDVTIEDKEEVMRKLNTPLFYLLRAHALEYLPPYEVDTEIVAEMAADLLYAWEREVKRPVGGYVYILAGKEEGEGFFKIGQTTDPSTRIPTLQIQLPWPTELRHKV